jgi:hypothetical protein
MPLAFAVLTATGAILVTSTAGDSPAAKLLTALAGGTLSILSFLVGEFAIRRLWREHSTVALPAEDQEQRNRRRMIERVRITWIKGVLERSLAVIAWIELGLERRPEAVRHPAALVVQWPIGQARELPLGTPIDTIFDEMGSALLILGAPGSGKTTLLLELARTLLDRAANDIDYPIPVVFNLASWAAERPSLAEWLVDELTDSYHVPRKIAQSWVETDQVLPLLDGLDEIVVLEHRQKCVRAINDFRTEHGLLQMVVCSRTEEYEQLLTHHERLRLLGAISIQPLTPQQVEKYLQQVGEQLAGVRIALQDDIELWDLLTTPLFLNIVALSYKGKPAAAVRKPGALVERRTQLFAAYVKAMLERRTPISLYPHEQTLRWLTWLARTMQRLDQSVLHLELMQPNWLPSPGQQRIVTRGVGAIIGLVGGLATGFLTGLGAGLAEALYPGVGEPTVSWLPEPVLTGSIFGLGAAVAAGLLIGLSAYEEHIRPAERLSWAWTEARMRLGTGMAYGLAGGLGAGLAFGFTYTWIVGLKTGLAFGVVASGLAVLAGGLSSHMSATRTKPNEGMRTSARNAIVVGLGGGLLVGLAAGVVFAMAFTEAVGLSIGMAFGLPFGLIVGLKQGGGDALRHIMLRILLVRNGFAPWRYVNFLEYATERIFLRRAGSGYIFVHRMLRDYFASFEGEK